MRTFSIELENYKIITCDLTPFPSVFFCHPQGVGADPHIALALPPESKVVKQKAEEPSFQHLDEEMTIRIGRAGPLSGKPPFIYPHQLLPFKLDQKKTGLLHAIKTNKHSSSTAVATVVPLILQ